MSRDSESGSPKYRVSELGYLFIHSGNLDHSQVENCLLHAIRECAKSYDLDISNLKLIVNVVCNREGKKFGHTYAWLNHHEIFYALIGKNLDGTERFKMVEDPNWSPPSDDEDEALEAAGDDWGAMADVEEAYECPQIKVKLEPLVTPPAVKYTPAQIKEVGEESEFGFIEIFEVQLSKKPGKLNTIFSNDIPDWITKEMLFEYFEKFERDKSVHQTKKREKFHYPQIVVKKKKDLREERIFCNITFSPMFRETATFLINIAKRVEFEKDGKKALLFFSQSKSKDHLKSSVI